MTTPIPPLAKASGMPPVLLSDHIHHVRTQFLEEIAPSYLSATDRYRRRTKGSDLNAMSLLAIDWHDAGKQHRAWQQACLKDYNIWKKWCEGGRVGIEPRGHNLMRAGIRHEIDSVFRILRHDKSAPDVVLVAIAAHHGKLSHHHRVRWRDFGSGEYKHLWARFNDLSLSVELHEVEKAIKLRYEFDGPRSLLQMADHRASALEGDNIVSTFKSFTYSFPSTWTKRGVQKVVSEFWDEPIALLRAPTGSGKTEAALLWAQHQVETGRCDRLVFAMPTRFTANALTITDPSTMSTRGLYHSSAWYQKVVANEGKAEEQWMPELDEARLLCTPVTVTTIDHLCMCLTGTREDHHTIFFNLANACVVIDEADFYDDFTQASLISLLRALRSLEVPVLLMSATLPKAYASAYGAGRVYEDTSDADRVRCRISRVAGPVLTPDGIKHILDRALNGEPMIIYANTVARAQAYYSWFEAKKMPTERLVIYHSRFTEPDKVNIEEKLRSMLGKSAWDGGTATGVAILTQIGELSVTISADLMVSDLCPLDRLVQRAGRLCRFGTGPGELFIISPMKMIESGEVISYPAPYGSFKSGSGWQPSPAYIASDSLLRAGDYSASDFVRLVDMLYPESPQLTSAAQDNQNAFHEAIVMNWLIIPSHEAAADADQTDRWRCRDIDPQVTVLTYLPFDPQFDDPGSSQWMSRGMWRRHLLEHGVNCRSYELKEAIDKGYAYEVKIGVGSGENLEWQQAWLVRPGYYSPVTGLAIKGA